VSEKGKSRTLEQAWSDFFGPPFDLRWAAAIRIGFALLVLVNLGVLGLDLNLWLGPSGVMPLDASRTVIDDSSHTIFELLPDTNSVIGICYGLAILHSFALLVGWFPRLQAFAVFFWLMAFQHRHMMIFDGEDQMFRLMAFFLAFVPTHHHWSVHTMWRGEHGPVSGPAWGLRFIQIQLTLVYFSAGVAKLRGDLWLDGTAIYYVTHLDDAFGRFPFPYAIFESMAVIKTLTWMTIVLELALPVALWVPRTRMIAVVIAAIFHIGLDYTMNLNLFHPLMLVALLAFVAGPRTTLPATIIDLEASQPRAAR
jgi:hypothetical protein